MLTHNDFHYQTGRIFTKPPQNSWPLVTNSSQSLLSQHFKARPRLVCNSQAAIFFNQLRLFENKVLAKINRDCLTLIDTGNAKVHRFSLSKFGQILIQRNYSQISHITSLSTPKAISFDQTQKIFWSQESLLPGEPWTNHPTNQPSLSKLISTLKPFYLETCNQTTFQTLIDEMKIVLSFLAPHQQASANKLTSDLFSSLKSKKLKCCQIHGDLTPSNVLICNRSFALVDWDRSLIGFPEEDLLLFETTSRFLLEPSKNVQNLHRLAIKITQYGENLNSVQQLWHQIPSLKRSPATFQLIKKVFLWRLLIWSFRFEGNSYKAMDLVQALGGKSLD